MKSNSRFETRAIHIGNEADKETGAVSPPIHLTSTFKQTAVGQNNGFDYSRAGNPTRKRLEDNIATLEGGKYGISFSSGMAATTALFQTLNAGDHVIIGHNVYGGTYRMSVKVLSRHGIEFEFVDAREVSSIEASIKSNTKLIFIETPTNPLLELSDINGVSKICSANGILLAVDNTFMSPYGQNPLMLGSNVVMHSATKFIGGHSDLLAGVLITNDPELAEQLYFIQKSGGAVPSPFDCWLMLRSTKTMALRVQRQSENALELAKRLNKEKLISSIIYPGLESHPQHELALAQQHNPEGEPIFGSIISLRCGSVQKRDSFLKNLKFFTLAESLGGVESLVCAPYDMTHVSVPEEIKNSMGLTSDLVRLSIGVEHVEDLYEDIIRALTE
tara:strand:+ start:10105 stop:11271 length:1167 start_codon:yes stop_codon:yes gene_type:complete